MRMIDEDEVGVKDKPEDIRYIKTITYKLKPGTSGVRAKDLIPNFTIIGNSKLGNGQGRHSLEKGEIKEYILVP